MGVLLVAPLRLHDVGGEGQGVGQAAVVVETEILFQICVIHEQRFLVRREPDANKNEARRLGATTQKTETVKGLGFRVCGLGFMVSATHVVER